MEAPIDAARREAYDTGRRIGHQPKRSFCYAPSASMYFDVRGNVIACCQNTTNPMGNVGEQSLREIWQGSKAKRMRAQLDDYWLPAGCDFCEWDLEHGEDDGVFARLFDERQVQAADPEWPTMMEFALSNRCNLACVMCNGDFSSTIRQREGREPLDVRYGDAFFEQLVEFLPHLELARFFGGEPFLIPEYQRIWDLLVEHAPHVECNVTTNGTIRTARTEAVLEALRFSIGVSIDGVSEETVERVRSGADHATVMANALWFREYCERVQTGFCLTYCLMTHNWHEFADFLRLAEDLDTTVALNTVLTPPKSSLYQLPPHELRDVVDQMERGAGASVHSLPRNGDVWRQQIERLRTWAAQLAARGGAEDDADQAFFERWGTYQGPDMGPDMGPSMGPSRGPSQGPDMGPSQGPATPVPVTLRRTVPGEDESVEAVRRRLRDRTGIEPDSLLVSADNVVVEAAGAGDCFVGIPTSMLMGQPFETLLLELDTRLGTVMHDPPVHEAPNVIAREVVYSDGERETRLQTATVVDPHGEGSGSITFAVVVPPD